MIFTSERPLIGDELVENNSHRPNVRTRVGVLAAKLFGRHVGQRAEQRSGLGLGSRRQAGDTEIDDLNDSIARHDDIGRLDVPVDHASTMSVIEGAAGLDDIPELCRDG